MLKWGGVCNGKRNQFSYFLNLFIVHILTLKLMSNRADHYWDFCPLSTALTKLEYLLPLKKDQSETVFFGCSFRIFNSFNLKSVCSISVSFCSSQKQPLRGVLRKRCSENMQQIYRRTPFALYLCWSLRTLNQIRDLLP